MRKNETNEIQTSCTHDKNGNMTVLPGMTCKYDAWNRLVEVGSNIRYDYNGLNQRVKKTVAGITTTSFFNSQWQELESTDPGTAFPLTTYVCGQRYIDDLVCRERGSEKLYSLSDVSWNVVATVDAAGVVQERMRYDAFGKVAWMNAAFTTKANSAYAWNRTFMGQVLDNESGLMLYRNRYYHTGLGRFVTRDPVGYRAGDWNVYRYISNTSCNTTDAHGLLSKPTKCERLLGKAKERLEAEGWVRYGSPNTVSPHDYKRIKECNVDIKCSKECAANPQAEAMTWVSGGRVYICFKEGKFENILPAKFNGLLIHEMFHAKQFLEENKDLCKKDCLSEGTQQPAPLPPEDPRKMTPEKRNQLYEDCAKKEKLAYDVINSRLKSRR